MDHHKGLHSHCPHTEQAEEEKEAEEGLVLLPWGAEAGEVEELGEEAGELGALSNFKDIHSNF